MSKIEIWDDKIPVLGNMQPNEISKKLLALGEGEESVRDMLSSIDVNISNHESFGIFERFKTKIKPYMHNDHTFGFIPSKQNGYLYKIYHAGDIKPSRRLRNTPIKITLDRFYISEYPGSGEHQILIEFYGQNQTNECIEHVAVNTLISAMNNEHVGIIGFPIFLGLKAGNQGVVFKCRTINVKNKQDSTVLSFLKSNTFKEGLKLASSFQPAIKHLTEIASGLTCALAKRHNNVKVQEFTMGLDFGSTPLGARLSEGSYIAMQIPGEYKYSWKWNDWIYNCKNGCLQKKNSANKIIPYNYIAFSIAPYFE
jgi:hypothetical protein